MSVTLSAFKILRLDPVTNPTHLDDGSGMLMCHVLTTTVKSNGNTNCTRLSFKQASMYTGLSHNCLVIIKADFQS